ncbi:doublesex- and mab-3-related transcription factor B1-like [Anoplopoma fimbria]|uniref:doublesex- and mab-3-related transcription factor B1-like n=1 Tax=Anoplopoma fimbria TaxID=229290 RepID=UPI0023EB416A|nr:doublesex- and mab-3-related transcription factor B1-like [Anoplopoma fimbria]
MAEVCWRRPVSNVSMGQTHQSALFNMSAAEQPRQPKCTRCRHHGIIVPQKGHIKLCPFLKCDCWKCYLITQRTRITALQRHLKKAPNNPQYQEQRLGVHTTAVGAVQPAAEGTCSSLTPGEDAGVPATCGVQCPPTDGAPVRRHDSRSRPAAEGEESAGLDSGKVEPVASSEEGPFTRFSAPYFGEYSQTALLPVIHVPWMSGYPSSYAPCPNLLLNMPWFPPIPAGLYNDGLHGPLMFPHFQSAAVHYPPPLESGPATDCRPVFFTLRPPPLPEPPQEELMTLKHPQSPLSEHTEPDAEELD